MRTCMRADARTPVHACAGGRARARTLRASASAPAQSFLYERVPACNFRPPSTPSSSYPFFRSLLTAVFVVGSSAHAVLPFMGQGTNCAFEDCAELLRLIELHRNDLPVVLREFTRHRKRNADAIADLAKEHAAGLELFVRVSVWQFCILFV